jgi:hypothetical protein
MRAARRAAAGAEPPSQIGGPGRWTGRGVTRALAPRCANGSPVQAARSTRTASSTARPRSASERPKARNSLAT